MENGKTVKSLKGDIVRHRLVKDIINAYENFSNGK